MSTWHQDQNPRPLWHIAKWTVVEDRPGQHTCVSRWNTQAEAQTHADRVGGYALPPGDRK